MKHTNVCAGNVVQAVPEDTCYVLTVREPELREIGEMLSLSAGCVMQTG